MGANTIDPPKLTGRGGDEFDDHARAVRELRDAGIDMYGTALTVHDELPAGPDYPIEDDPYGNEWYERAKYLGHTADLGQPAEMAAFPWLGPDNYSG